ncbi:uncharacterized protein LOC106013993 [Aplysia californica]|uniref:Uncharacterized protein LOC106013993 n=1 Tax=Aplysia californica TaxID=6500 RepID=A0ABM1AF12_APLCA|nr:uncharacterized protein LOC106013993 [Aplysia californica]
MKIPYQMEKNPGPARARFRREEESNRCVRCVSSLGLKTGIGVFVAVVILSFGLSAWNLAISMTFWSEQRFPLYPGDEVALSELTEDLSSVLCQQYQVSVDNGRAVTYLLDADNMVTSPTRDILTLQVDKFSPSPNRTFYLLAGSELSVSACATPLPLHQPASQSLATVVIEEKHYYRDLYQVSRTFTFDLSSPCNETVYRQHVDRSRSFRVHVGSWPGQDYTGHVTLSLDRQYYTVAPMLNACYYDKTCVFDLEFNRHVEVLVLLENDPGHPRSPASLATACTPRLAFWLLLFGLTPALILVISLIVCWVCGRGDDHTGPGRRGQGGGASSVKGRASSTRGGVTSVRGGATSVRGGATSTRGEVSATKNAALGSVGGLENPGFDAEEGLGSNPAVGTKTLKVSLSRQERKKSGL